MSSIWLIIGGVVLRMNPEWFNGASMIGLILLIFGGIAIIIELLFLFGLTSVFKN